MQSFTDWRCFRRSTNAEKENLLRQVVQQQLQLQERLLAMLNTGDSDTKRYAAYLLGKYRFSQAVDSLAEHIALEDMAQRSRLWYWGQYPAQEALRSIGNPSIPAMLRNLEEKDDTKVRALSLDVIYFVDKDRDIVQLRLQKALNAESEPQKKERLQAAIKWFDQSTIGK